MTALAFLAMQTFAANVALAAPPAPDGTVSHYLTSALDSDVCDMGTTAGHGQNNLDIDSDALVILDFSSPVKFTNGDFGGSRGLLAAPERIGGVTGPNATGIESTLQHFANCYANHNPSGSSMKIVAGVSNDIADDPMPAVTNAHGHAWGNLIVRMNAWAVSQSLASQVSFNGGLDAESGFGGSITQTQNWETGYSGSNQAWNLFNFGDAAGCPSYKAPSSTCNWARNDIINLAWSSGEVTPFPEIYDEEPGTANPPTSVNAQQWHKLSIAAISVAGSKMNFAGGLSQFNSCIGREHSVQCDGLDETGKQSWQDLWNETNCTFDGPTPCNTTDGLRWTTEIGFEQTG